MCGAEVITSFKNMTSCMKQTSLVEMRYKTDHGNIAFQDIVKKKRPLYYGSFSIKRLLYVFLGNYDVISTFKVSKHMSKIVFFYAYMICCILH